MYSRAYRSLVIGLLAWGVVWFTSHFVLARLLPGVVNPSPFVVLPVMAVVIWPGLITAGYVAAALARQPSLEASLTIGVIIAVVSLIHAALLSLATWQFGAQVFFLPQAVSAIPATLLGGYLHERVGVWRKKREAHGA
jgi:hypothetical protein